MPRYSNAPQAPRVPRPAPPPLPEAEVVVKAANGNTAPAALNRNDATPSAVPSTSEQAAASVVVPLPLVPDAPRAVAAATAAAGLVDITLRRETATFSVPVSEAVLPDGLRHVLARANDHGAAARALQPRLEHADAPNPRSSTEIEGGFDHDDDHINPDDFTEHDLALIGRIAPPAAE
jgi:hypothetical protein